MRRAAERRRCQKRKDNEVIGKEGDDVQRVRWQRSGRAMSSTDNNNELPAVRINIPRRYYLLPGAAVLTGISIGLFRGSRTASLRFLAENAHRPPKTVRGWYLYNKTKNYRVLLGGLKEAGADATKLGLTAAAWVALEEGCTSLGLGLDDFREVVAGLGTGTLLGAVCMYLLRCCNCLSLLQSS